MVRYSLRTPNPPSFQAAITGFVLNDASRELSCSPNQSSICHILPDHVGAGQEAREKYFKCGIDPFAQGGLRSRMGTTWRSSLPLSSDKFLKILASSAPKPWRGARFARNLQSGRGGGSRAGVGDFAAYKYFRELRCSGGS
jgi:hypothetical protein